MPHVARIYRIRRLHHAESVDATAESVGVAAVAVSPGTEDPGGTTAVSVGAVSVGRTVSVGETVAVSVGAALATVSVDAGGAVGSVDAGGAVVSVDAGAVESVDVGGAAGSVEVGGAGAAPLASAEAAATKMLKLNVVGFGLNVYPSGLRSITVALSRVSVPCMNPPGERDMLSLLTPACTSKVCVAVSPVARVRLPGAVARTTAQS